MEFLSLPDDYDKESTSRGLASLNHIPQAQKQEVVAIDLSKDGNILLYRSPGTGKTTFLQTAAMDLAGFRNQWSSTLDSIATCGG